MQRDFIVIRYEMLKLHKEQLKDKDVTDLKEDTNG